MHSGKTETLVCTLAVLISVPVGMVLSALLMALFSLDPLARFTIMFTYLATFGFVLLLAFLLSRRFSFSFPGPAFSGIPAHPWAVPCALVMVFLWNIVVTPAAALLPEYEDTQLDTIARSGLFSVLTATLLAPLVEETIFRGILIPNLGCTIGKGMALFVSAAVFAVSHVYPLQALLAFGAGFVFGLIFLYTGSVAAVALAHVLYNSLIYLLYSAFPSQDDLLEFLVPSLPLRIAVWTVALVLLLVLLARFYRLAFADRSCR